MGEDRCQPSVGYTCYCQGREEESAYSNQEGLELLLPRDPGVGHKVEVA